MTANDNSPQPFDIDDINYSQEKTVILFEVPDLELARSQHGYTLWISESEQNTALCVQADSLARCFELAAKLLSD